MTTPYEDRQASQAAPPPGGRRGRHVLTRTPSPRRLRASLVLPHTPAESDPALSVIRRPAWSAVLSQPVNLPPEIIRRRAEDSDGAEDPLLSDHVPEPRSPSPLDDLGPVAYLDDLSVHYDEAPTPGEPPVVEELAAQPVEPDGGQYEAVPSTYEPVPSTYEPAPMPQLVPGHPVSILPQAHDTLRRPRRRARVERRWIVASVVGLAVCAVAAAAVVAVAGGLVPVELPRFGTDQAAGDVVVEGSGTGITQVDDQALALEAPVRQMDTVPIADLQPGQCFQDLPDGPGPYSAVAVVDCAQSHDNQVVAVFDLAVRPWPGADAVADEAGTRCRQSGEQAITTGGDGAGDVAFWVLVPTEQGWVDSDDRLVQCMAYYPSGPTVGSLVG